MSAAPIAYRAAEVMHLARCRRPRCPHAPDLQDLWTAVRLHSAGLLQPDERAGTHLADPADRAPDPVLVVQVYDVPDPARPEQVIDAGVQTQLPGPVAAGLLEQVAEFLRGGPGLGLPPAPSPPP